MDRVHSFCGLEVEQEVAELREAAEASEQRLNEQQVLSRSLTLGLSLSLFLSGVAERCAVGWASYRWCMLYLTCGCFPWDRVDGEPGLYERQVCIVLRYVVNLKKSVWSVSLLVVGIFYWCLFWFMDHGPICASDGESRFGSIIDER